jgi:glycolate oxidase iron-sulfur subunit
VDRFRQKTAATGKPLAARLKSAALRQVLTGPGFSELTKTSWARRAMRAIKKRAEARDFGRGWGIAELGAGLPEISVQPIQKDWTGFHPAESEQGLGEVWLFLGCTAVLLDSETLASAIRLMNRLGIGVRVPEGQTCCGALHWHAGESAAASERVARNLQAFGDTRDQATVVSFASGCGAMLRDYGGAFPSVEAQRFSRRIQDIGQFLAETPWPEDFKLRPLAATVCVHSPCSLKNVLRADRHIPALLGRVPHLKVISLPASTHCCGAAGSYLLEHPQMARKLRDDVLDPILAAGPDYLVTSNPGCAMHLRAGLKQRGRKTVEVLHPVTLLARCLTER